MIGGVVIGAVCYWSCLLLEVFDIGAGCYWSCFVFELFVI